MKKIVKINPFGVYKVTDEVIKSVEQNLDEATGMAEAVKQYTKSIRKGSSAQFLGINPNQKEAFTFIPIIHNNQFFISTFPDPIQLYFSLAYSNYEFATQTRENIVIQGGQSGPMNFVNSYLYNWHLKYKISSIIFLHSAVEAFINLSMPDDFVYKQEVIGGSGKRFSKQITEYPKELIEKELKFKEKLNEVLTQFSGIGLQKNHQEIYDKLLNINSIRNDLIHLRSVKDEKNTSYFQKSFDKVVNEDLLPYVNAVKDFVNLVKPGYIELKDFVSNPSNGEAIFNFEHYKAFRLDISIFLKILEVKAEVITLSIPKSDEKDYNLVLNFIMQNLDVMAEQQWIYFAETTETESELRIKVTKNMNKMSRIEPSEENTEV